MSLSVALKFIYRLASRVKSDHCLTQNEMLKEIKSKVCESCHSLHCSPTHPCRASDGEKLFFFFLKTHILFLLIFYLCEWKPPRCLLMELSDKRKMCKLAKHVCVVQYLWRAVGAKAFMCAFIASAGPGDERGHKHLILFYFLNESSWAGGQKHVESSSREEKKRVLTGWEHVRTWLSLSFQIQFFRVCASQWACLSFSTRSKPSILEYVDLQLWW